MLERIETGDAVVFVGNSVLMTLRRGFLAERLTAMSRVAFLHVLSEGIEMHGIAPDSLVAGIEVIDYPGLVELTLKHEVIQSWY